MNSNYLQRVNFLPLGFHLKIVSYHISYLPTVFIGFPVKADMFLIKALRPVYTDRPNVTLTGGTFDLFDGNCDGQNGLHTHLPINVAFDGDVDETGSLGVNKALLVLIPRTTLQVLRSASHR